MTSHIYLARGEKDGLPVMKIGKANDVRQREKQIGIPVEIFVEVSSIEDALRLEQQMHSFARQQGARGVGITQDWYVYDQVIFDLLQQEMITVKESYASLVSTEYQIGYSDGYAARIEEEIEAAKAEIVRLKLIVQREQNVNQYVKKLEDDFHATDDLDVIEGIFDKLQLIKQGWYPPDASAGRLTPPRVSAAHNQEG